jgi:hypothetical protein
MPWFLVVLKKQNGAERMQLKRVAQDGDECFSALFCQIIFCIAFVIS